LIAFSFFFELANREKLESHLADLTLAPARHGAHRFIDAKRTSLLKTPTLDLTRIRHQRENNIAAISN
jgi:hypothetical protein